MSPYNFVFLLCTLIFLLSVSNAFTSQLSACTFLINVEMCSSSRFKEMAALFIWLTLFREFLSFTVHLLSPVRHPVSSSTLIRNFAVASSNALRRLALSSSDISGVFSTTVQPSSSMTLSMPFSFHVLLYPMRYSLSVLLAEKIKYKESFESAINAQFSKNLRFFLKKMI